MLLFLDVMNSQLQELLDFQLNRQRQSSQASRGRPPPLCGQLQRLAEILVRYLIVPDLRLVLTCTFCFSQLLYHLESVEIQWIKSPRKQHSQFILSDSLLPLEEAHANVGDSPISIIRMNGETMRVDLWLRTATWKTSPFIGFNLLVARHLGRCEYFCCIFYYI